MNQLTAQKAVNISPVNIEERKNLGIRSGDTVRVWQKIEERGKTRLQAFEGLVLARKHGDEAGGTFTVRKSSEGIGVEKIFPLYSPNIDKIEIVKRAKVRRAKLYYVREKVAREMKRALRRMQMMTLATQSEQEQAEAKKKAEEEAAAKAKEEAKAAEEAAQKAEAEAAKAEETTDTPDTETDTPAEEEAATDAPEEGGEEAKKE